MMFPVWCLVYGNTSAGLWALFSSLPAGIVLYQHLRFKSASLAQTFPPSKRGAGLLLGVGGGDGGLPRPRRRQRAAHEALQRQLRDHRRVGFHVFQVERRTCVLQPSLPHTTAERSRVQRLLRRICAKLE